MKTVYVGKKAVKGSGLAICKVLESDISSGQIKVFNRESGEIETMEHGAWVSLNENIRKLAEDTESEFEAKEQAAKENAAKPKEKTLKERNEEHRQYLLGIAHTIRDIAEGTLYKLDGEYVTDGEMESLIEAGKNEEDDFEPVTIYDYLAGVLDVTYYTTGRDGEYLGVRLMLTCGGPNVFLDTYRRTLELYWWNERATVDLLPNEANEVDAMWSELYNCC